MAYRCELCLVDIESTWDLVLKTKSVALCKSCYCDVTDTAYNIAKSNISKYTNVKELLEMFNDFKESSVLIYNNSRIKLGASEENGLVTLYITFPDEA